MRRVVLLLSVAVTTACTASGAVVTGPLPKVPVELVPASLQDGELALAENTDEETRKLFAGGDDRLLVADGRLWEIRDGQKLIGTLQVSTLRPEADPRLESIRSSIVNGLMPAARREVDVGDVLVYLTASEDKFVYLWFGQTLFVVLQVKGNTLDPDGMLAELVEFQRSGPHAEMLLTVDDELYEDD